MEERRGEERRGKKRRERERDELDKRATFCTFLEQSLRFLRSWAQSYLYLQQ
jgi:hypothetical protein